MGLIVSVIKLISDISRGNDVNIVFKHSSFSEEQSGDGLKLVIYRIIQEQLNNILKHADASEVEIELKNEQVGVELIIKDNGKGFDTTKESLGIGITNIISRAELYKGTANFISQPGKGCSLIVSFPVETL